MGNSAKNAGKYVKTDDICLASTYRVLATRKVILIKRRMGSAAFNQTKDPRSERKKKRVGNMKISQMAS